MEVEDIIVKIFVEKRELNFQHPDYELDTVSSTGSGFFIEKDLILTCYHVVCDSINIMVSHRSLDKIKIPVDILKVFPDDDMAIASASPAEPILPSFAIAIAPVVVRVVAVNA